MPSEEPDRPIYCGNFEYEATSREIERIFEKYGPVERVDMKTGFAFVYMRDKRDAEDAIRGLDRSEFGYKRRLLNVEWAKAKREPDEARGKEPSKCLFVANFDSRRTRERDLDDMFSPHGRIVRLQIKRGYAFIEYRSLDEASRACREMQGVRLFGNRLSVEFVQNHDPAGHKSRSRSRSPRRRSPSPSRSRSRDRSRDRSRSRSR